MVTVKPGDTVESVIVDGNAVAGLLSDALRSDATLVQLTCGACGDRNVLAEARVELDEAAAIVRCRSCTRTMLTVLRRPTGIALRIGTFEMLVPVATG